MILQILILLIFKIGIAILIGNSALGALDTWYLYTRIELYKILRGVNDYGT